MYSVDQEMKYFKTSPHLEQDGMSSHFVTQETGCLMLEESKQRGYYFLKGIDSEINEMTWNRLKLSEVVQGEVLSEIYVLATDHLLRELNEEVVSIEEVLQSTEISPQDKLKFLVDEGAKVYKNHKDLLLHDFEGRYLWIAITCYNLEGKSYVLEGLEVEYPMQTFVDYLPEIYAEGGDFLRRYMGIFQSLYLDVERQIDQLPEYLDIDTTPERFLNELGKWVGIDNSKDIFTLNQMRQMIPRAVALNSGKGTKATLEKILTLYTGTKPVIVEYFKWSSLVKDERNRKVYKNLYGHEANYFTVIIQVDKKNKLINRDQLHLLIDEYKPAMTTCHLVILEATQRSDWHCYLGVNSYLTSFKEARLEEMRLTGDTIMQLG